MTAGHDPVVLTRRRESREAAEKSGWRCADTVEEAVQNADVVVVGNRQAGTPLVVDPSRPPASTLSCIPVTQRDSSDARKRTAALMSDGWM